jgi:hypothetical protein
MDFFNTLTAELQKQAQQEKMNELYDNWYESYISDGGDKLPHYVEENLLSYLPSPITELAIMFYEKKGKTNA